MSTNKGEVYFIPTIHKFHQTNPNYSYDSLKTIVARLNPDIIAVEIRPEDLGQDLTYLSKSYPHEMIMMTSWFPDIKIVGFDWYGDDVEGKLISDDYWNINPLKLLEQQLDQDFLYKDRVALCDARKEERLNILNTSTLEQLLKSADAEIVKEHYHCLEIQFKGTPYEYLYKFSKERDEHILANINNIIKKNSDKRIVILTGDDHYQMLKDKFVHKPIY